MCNLFYLIRAPSPEGSTHFAPLCHVVKHHWNLVESLQQRFEREMCAQASMARILHGSGTIVQGVYVSEVVTSTVSCALVVCSGRTSQGF